METFFRPAVDFIVEKVRVALQGLDYSAEVRHRHILTVDRSNPPTPECSINRRVWCMPIRQPLLSKALYWYCYPTGGIRKVRFLVFRTPARLSEHTLEVRTPWCWER